MDQFRPFYRSRDAADPYTDDHSVADGAQVDLDLNGDDALSLGWALDDAGVSIVSTLFPNCYVTLSNETLAQMMAQMAQNMPGAGGEGGAGGFDMAAMQAVFGVYYQKWLAACTAAGASFRRKPFPK